jgi:hypothetical protein
MGSHFHWEDKDTLSVTILDYIVDNFVISHIQSYKSHGAWVELNKIFESKDVVTKMFLKGKLHKSK